MLEAEGQDLWITGSCGSSCLPSRILAAALEQILEDLQILPAGCFAQQGGGPQIWVVLQYETQAWQVA